MSQKVFGTDGIRGPIGSKVMDPLFVLKLGWAVGKVFARERDSKILIGKDTRVSGYMLESALEAGLSAAGMDVLLLGPLPTPAVAYLTQSLRAQAGIVISASHNLYQDNGIKFFSAQGTKLADDVEAKIEQQLNEPMQVVTSEELGKATRLDDAGARYVEFCKNRVPETIAFDGFKIVLDCAHGATYRVAPLVFRELGAEVITIGTHPDGFNINAACGSTKPKLLQQQVIQHQADLGIALDGDGDRVILVDHKGEVVDGDEILYIITKYYLETKRLQGGVVGTLMSNMGLEVALQSHGIRFQRTRVGDRYVFAELKRLGWLLGGESSGHIICGDATTTGDGIISTLKVVTAMVESGKALHELKAGMQKFPQKLLNVATTSPEKTMQLPIIQQAIVAAEKQLNGHGRVLLRASGTEPLVRVMVEADDEVLVDHLVHELAEIVKENQI